ncbi:MAG TPA: glycoside hydrolase family 18 protein, partial [bacterium]
MKKFQTAFFSLLLMGVTLPGWAKPNHLVLGYSACWFDGIYPPESYNYDALTHIARSFLLPKADGTIISQGGFWDPTLEKMAHAHGVKMIVSLGGAAANADNWLAMSRDAKAEKFFFDNLEKLIVDNHYDGVDIDWEPSALTGADQATYTQFLQNLRKRFPNWIITAALGGGEYWAKHISWTEVAKQVDWINWMTYDYAGSWTGHSGHNANLYAPKNPKVNSDLDIDSNLTNLETKYGVAANKLVLGLPFYGIQFFSEHMGDSFIGDAIKAGAEIQYYEIAPILSGKNYKAFWDEGAQVPYLEKVGGGYIISYDDPKSISLKCDYAVKKGMKGVMIWNLGADLVGDHAVLLDTIAKAYGAPTMTMPASGLTKTVQTFILSLKDVYS